MTDSYTYQQVQAIVGASSAHPGAFIATLEFLSDLAMPPGSRVLECGCGTGRTACHLAGLGYDVTAVDINPVMLEKAKRRAKLTGVSVEWRQADALALPLPDDCFDYVIVESVTIFIPAARATSEYLRVLKPGGHVADLEMAKAPELKPQADSEIRRFFGAASLPTFEGWRDAYLASGFSPVQLWRPRPIDIQSPQLSQQRYPDAHQFVDPNATADPLVTDVLTENALIMVSHYQHLGYVGIVAEKPSQSERIRSLVS